MINAAASIPGPLLASFVIATAGRIRCSSIRRCARRDGVLCLHPHAAEGTSPVETRDLFTPVPQGSPAVLPLDPRAPAQEKEP
jgi:hypothetical protein